MKETNLKKEFSKSTVQRMRNIITGKTGDKTQVQTGWENKKYNYSEGDQWEEVGKQWTIKNGIKQNITKLDSLKYLAVLPLTCPCCEKPMKVNDLNKKMYNIHKICFDCVIDMETKIRIEGKWDEYVSKQRTASKNDSLVDFEKAIEAWMKDNDSFITEQGDIESWGKVDKTKIYEELKSNIQKLKNIEI